MHPLLARPHITVVCHGVVDCLLGHVPAVLPLYERNEMRCVHAGGRVHPASLAAKQQSLLQSAMSHMPDSPELLAALACHVVRDLKVRYRTFLTPARLVLHIYKYRSVLYSYAVQTHSCMRLGVEQYRARVVLLR